MMPNLALSRQPVRPAPSENSSRKPSGTRGPMRFPGDQPKAPPSPPARPADADAEADRLR